MKEHELRAPGNCAICGRGLLATGIPLFWRLTIDRFGVDLDAVRRQYGLTMLLGGNARIAAAMGPDEDMAQPLMEPRSFAVCESCGLVEGKTIAELALPE